MLSSDVMSISEVLHDGVTGFLAKDSSDGEIAAGIQRALRSGKEVRETARERVIADFSYPKIRATLLASYSSLMS